MDGDAPQQGSRPIAGRRNAPDSERTIGFPGDDRYNRTVLRTLAAIILTAVLLAASHPPTLAQSPTPAHETVIVMPFENVSGAPGLEWISESFPETLTQRFSSPGVFVLTREDRLRAYDWAGMPAELHPTRATMYRLMEQLDVDYMVIGRYGFDGRTFTATAQLLDMQHKKLLPEAQESGPLTSLINIQTALSWDLLQSMKPGLSASKAVLLAGTPPVRLDAFENYVRGVLAGTTAEKTVHFREATRLNPTYDEAWLQLGKTYFEQRQYDAAIEALGHVPEANPAAREANFYLGLAAYSLGDFSRAQSAFNFVAARLPLTEIDNNLGVVTARLGDPKRASERFQRAVQQDPSDPDYHFNLAIAQYRAGDLEGAKRQLQQCLALRAGDNEARSILAMLENDAGSAGSLKSLQFPNLRIKQNYDENSFRQLLLGIQTAAEERLSHTDPATHAQFYLSRGQELYGQGFVSEAEEQFRQAIALAPDNAEAHVALARALEANDDFAGARAEAETALGIKVFIDPMLVLARLDLRDNRADAAAERVDRAWKLDPANPSVQTLKRAVAAKLAEKAQPLPN
jgi:tetratricopeptide (TPR) repeat protein/TolB-like protein